MKEAIESAKEALKSYSNKNADIPLRTSLDILKNKGKTLFMPGYVKENDSLGIKLVSIYPENLNYNLPSITSTMLLINEKTGELCSILDGTYLTQLRTGAVAGAATDILSKKDSKIFALIGCGEQAECQLEAILNIRNIKIVKIFDISKEKREIFVEKMKILFSKKYFVEIESVNSSEEAIKDADIITLVTTSKIPVFDGKYIKNGAHINGMGSYTPEMQEIDEYILKKSKVYVDTKNGVFHESGDLIIPISKNLYSFNEVMGELGEVILSKITGREKMEEITLFKSVGSSVLDIVVAKNIYEKCIKNNIGEDIIL